MDIMVGMIRGCMDIMAIVLIIVVAGDGQNLGATADIMAGTIPGIMAMTMVILIGIMVGITLTMAAGEATISHIMCQEVGIVKTLVAQLELTVAV